MPADRTPLLFDLPKPAAGAKSARKKSAERPAQSRWVDRHTGLLFNEASPRTFRVYRDLRREARPDLAIDLAHWQLMRTGAAADDRTLWRALKRESRELKRRFHELQAELGPRARLWLRRRNTSEVRTYVYLGRRAVRAASVRSDGLRAAGIRSLTMPIKEFGRAEAAINEKVDHVRALAGAIDEAWAALQAAERRLGQARPRPLMFPPLIGRRLATLRSYRARGVEVVGTYCLTPHIQFEGWRIRMLAYADALKASVMTINKFYNVRRNRERARYGEPRRVRVGLISCISDSSWLLPPLEWRLIKRTRESGNVITGKTVKGLIRMRRGEWRDTGAAEPVMKHGGHLNPAALALCHQPEMYSLLRPFDDLVVRYNEIARRVLLAAAPVIGTRPSVHPFGATPRAQWVGSVKTRWWV